jgi:hypothetical protein
VCTFKWRAGCSGKLLRGNLLHNINTQVKFLALSNSSAQTRRVLITLAGVLCMCIVLKSPALAYRVKSELNLCVHLQEAHQSSISRQTKWARPSIKTSLVCICKRLHAAAPVPTPHRARCTSVCTWDLEIFNAHNASCNTKLLENLPRGAGGINHAEWSYICAVSGRDRTHAHAAQDMSYGFLRAHLPKCILKLDARAALDVLFQFPLRERRAWKVNRFNLCQMSGWIQRLRHFARRIKRDSVHIARWGEILSFTRFIL